MPFLLPFVYGFFGALGSSGAAAAAAGVTSAFGQALVVAGVYAAQAVVGAAISAATSAVLAPSTPSLGRQLSINLESMPPKKIVYGQTRVGGDFIYISTGRPYWDSKLGYTTSEPDGEEKLLHMVIEIAGHPIQSIDSVYIDDLELPFTSVRESSARDLYNGKHALDSNGVVRRTIYGGDYDKLVFAKYYPEGATVADEDLLEASKHMGFNSNPWMSDMIGRDIAYTYFRFFFKPTLFQGTPKLSFDIKGKKDIYDPRDDSTGYSDNPALCLANFLMMPVLEGGLGADYSEINEDALIEAANVCDETITITETGETQKRYFCGGQLSTNDAPVEIITTILSTMAGALERANGQWVIKAGAYSAPVHTITESELISRPTLALNQNSKDAFNSARAVVRAEETNWQPAPCDSVEFNITGDIDSVSYNVEGTKFNVAGNQIENGDRIKLQNWTGTTLNNTKIPNGFEENVYYYAVSSSASSFYLSNSKGGSAIVGSHNFHTNLAYIHDYYLTRDGERKIRDFKYPLVNDITLGRRLAIISLKDVRQEIYGSMECKLGTPYCTPFALGVNDTFRWIDSFKDFWSTVSGSSPQSASVVSNGTITDNGHGLIDGDPLIIVDSGDSDYEERDPYYVVSASTNTFQISRYRGGTVETTTNGSNVTYQIIEGKLFKVVGWKLNFKEGIPYVTIDFFETNPDVYTWNNFQQELPEQNPGISPDNPWVVRQPVSASVQSGTDTLYIKTDGTVGSRARIAWSKTKDAQVSEGGFVEIQYKRSPYPSLYDISTDRVYAPPHPTMSWDGDVGDYGTFETTLIPNLDAFRFVTSGSDTLPTPISGGADYFAQEYDVNSSSFKVSYGKGIDVEDITSRGSFNWTPITGDANQGLIYIDIEKDWVSHVSVPGISTETFIYDLKDGEFYDFRIRFKNSLNSESEWTYLYNVYVAGKEEPPNPVTSFSSSYDDTNLNVKLQWNNPSDLDLANLLIQRKLPSDPTFVDLITVGKGSNTYLDYDIVANPADQTYDYRIQAFDTSGNSSSFASSSTTVDGIDLVDGFTAYTSSTSEFSFFVDWSDSGQDETIIVEWWDLPEKREVDSTWYSEGDAPIEIDTKYSGSYFVKARRLRDGVTSYAVSSSVTVPGYLPPESVTDVTASYDWQNNTIQLDWVNPTGRGLRNIYIEREITRDGTTKTYSVVTQSFTTTTYVDDVVIPSSSVSYFITPINLENETGSTVQYDLFVPQLPVLTNFSYDTSSRLRLNVSWDYDSSYPYDYAEIEYLDTFTSTKKTEYFLLSAETGSLNFHTDGSTNFTASRVRYYDDPGYLLVPDIRSEPIYGTADIIGYGEILPPETQSFSIEGQTFKMSWTVDNDLHKGSLYKIYVNEDNDSSSAVLLSTTTDTHFSVKNPYPNSTRHYWVVKSSSFMSMESGYSTVMSGTCGYDMDKTSVSDYSTTIIHDPETGSNIYVGAGVLTQFASNLDPSEDWEFEIEEENYSLNVGPAVWTVKVENNSADECFILYGSVIYPPSGSNTLVLFGNTRCPAGETKIDNKTLWTTFIPNELQESLPTGSYSVRTFIGGRKYIPSELSPPFSPITDNVTCSIVEGRVHGQYFPTPPSIYSFKPLP